MSLPLATLYRKLSSKDQARVRRHIANPVLFLLEEYHDLSPAEQKKFKSSIGVDQKSKISKAEPAPKPEVKENLTSKQDVKEISVTEVQNGIESMELDGAPVSAQPLPEATTKVTTSDPPKVETQIVPYQPPIASSESKVEPKGPAEATVNDPKPTNSSDTDTDEDSEEKYNSDEDEDYNEEEEEDEY